MFVVSNIVIKRHCLKIKKLSSSFFRNLGFKSVNIFKVLFIVAKTSRYDNYFPLPTKEHIHLLLSSQPIPRCFNINCVSKKQTHEPYQAQKSRLHPMESLNFSDQKITLKELGELFIKDFTAGSNYVTKKLPN